MVFRGNRGGGASRGGGGRGGASRGGSRGGRGFHGKKMRGSPRIPQSIREQIENSDDEEIEARFVIATPGNLQVGDSRKLLRKRKQLEKKQRKNAYFSGKLNQQEEPEQKSKKSEKKSEKKLEKTIKNPKKAEKEESSESPPLKKRKISEETTKPIPEPEKFNPDEELAVYYEKKLKKIKASGNTNSQLDGWTLVIVPLIFFSNFHYFQRFFERIVRRWSRNKKKTTKYRTQRHIVILR